MSKLKRVILRKRLVYLLYNVFLLVASYLLGRLFQVLILILFYNVIQDSFNYRFHADALTDDSIKASRLCVLITIVVECLYLLICININVSVYGNLLILLFFSTISALLQYANVHSEIYIKPSFQNHILERCEQANISELAKRRLIAHYIEKKTIKEIAIEECVEEASIKQSIRRTKRKVGL